MRFFNFLTGKKKVAGLIGYFDLGEWWLSEFSESERRHILEKYQGDGSAVSLTSGEIKSTSRSSIFYLYSLAGWFSRKGECYLAQRILKKAEELVDSRSSILDRHFLYQHKLEAYYKDRDDEEKLEKAIEACRQQIALSEEARNTFLTEYEGTRLPSHRGYEQLAIILEKQKRYQEVIDLCSRAKAQEWSGDWEKRIERCRKKLG